jgi:hypothetical protein
MERKKLTRIMPTLVGIGFCVIAGVKLWAMSGAAAAPDPASGRDQAAMFAPAVSTNWSYITHTQIVVLGLVTAAVLLLAALMVGLQVHDRFFGDADDAADPDAPVPPPVTRIVRKGRNFGIRTRG